MKKCNSQKGFTLSEVMISMLIILMVTAIVAQGIPLAQRAYVKVVDSANAQVLLSNTTTVLRDELGTASKIEPFNTDTTDITYYSGKNGMSRRIFEDSDLGIATIVSYQDADGNWKTEKAGLVNKGLSISQNLKIDLDEIKVEKDKITISGLKVTKNGSTDPLAELNTYVIDRMNQQSED